LLFLKVIDGEQEILSVSGHEREEQSVFVTAS
jgi:hypothetical protein